MKIKYLPNLITILRIIGTLCLFFTDPFSGPFFLVYTICGLTDVLDGWIARATHSVTETGARLDSVADLCFYAAMLLKVFPSLWEMLPRIIWCVVAGIIVLRLVCYIIAAVKYRRFASLHTYLNKLTGAVLFVVPYTLRTPIGIPICWLVCAIAAVSAIEELIIHLRQKEYRTDVKSARATSAHS